MVNNMDHGLPKFSLLGYDDWKIMMEAHLYALHDCMWMVLEDGPLKIQMENLERNPATPDVVQYIPKPKEKWDDRDCKKHNLDNVAKAAIFKTLDPITFSKIKHLKTAMEVWQGLGKLCEGLEDLRKQKIEVLLEKFKSFKMLPGESFDMLDERFHKILNDLASLNHVLSPKEKNVRLLRSLPTEWKPGHWKSACPYPKVEKYRERERNEKKKKAMVAAESDESSSSSSDEEALVCIERRAEKSNHEDRWTMSEDDTLCLMAKDDVDQEVTSQTSCSSSYESIPTSENVFDQFKKMMKDFEEINLKHSSLTEENKLLSEENLKFTEGRKSQLNEITQLKTENESLSEKVKSLNKELGTLKSKEAVDKLLETTKHKGREGLGFDSSSYKRKGKKTFIPPKPTAKPNKQKGKEKEKPIEVSKKVVPPKNYRKLDKPQKGNNFRRKPFNPHYTRGYTHYGVDRSFPRNSEWRTMPRYSHPPPQKLFVPPKYAYNRHRTHYALPRQNHRSYQPGFARRKQEITPRARRKFYAYNHDYNPNKFRAARKIPCNFKLDVGTHTINYSGPKLNWMAEEEVSQTPIAIFEEPNEAEDSDSLSRYISNFALDEAEGESERTLKITDEEDVQEDAESLPLQLFQRTSSPHQVTNFPFHSSSTHTLPDEIPETWTRKVQGLIESALASQHASFRQEIELMEAKHTELIEKSEKKHSADLKEISKSVEKTLEIISLLSKTVSNTMEIYTSNSQLQFNEFNKVKEQIANVTIGLQKQMSLLQMDIRSALAIASANQVVTKDYLKVIIDNQKEAYKLFRLIGAHSGNRKMEVILQQHSPSPIPQLPIAVNEGEASYVPSHLHMTNLILEAQQRNSENSAQHLSSSGLDGTEFIGAVADHFSDAAQTEERRENLRRIKELCGNMHGISEVAGSSKRKRN
ncbi:unnamed protein product [Cuscuta campestris]|uniref:DUF4219 domain-containing protein n=1 Tax=Cuscuta campestris TaxID=132261 RepID=A0A484N4K4_9ASTE|nr:unnamed protein product [Cuscuta campestris]